MKQKKFEDRYKTGEYALSASQIKKLLLSFDSIFEKAIIHLAVSVGLRRNDIVNIKRNDLDVNTGKLTYYEHKKSRTRTVKIPSDDAISTLKLYLNIRDATHPKNKWLFPSPLKTPKYKDKHISDRSIYNIFNEHLDIIGIDRRPFHSLRSTCIKLCMESDWREYETAALVGDTVRVIQEHYLTPSKSQMDEIAELKQII